MKINLFLFFLKIKIRQNYKINVQSFKFVLIKILKFKFSRNYVLEKSNYLILNFS